MLPRLLDPDTDWTAAARTGDAAALTRLYAEHGPMVHRIGYRILGTAADAEDLVQDVFVGLPEALRHFHGGNLGAWMRTLATRAALQRLRTAGRRREQSLELHRHVRAAGPTESALAARLTLADALRQLPEGLRVVFVLKEMEGHSHAEVAQLLGIRPGTSEVRLHRAYNRLRVLLESAR